MKCDNLVTEVIGRNGKVVIIGKKGKLKLKFFKPMLMIDSMMSQWDDLSDELKKRFESLTPPKGSEVCGGNIIVTVEAIDEPQWGGTSASLEITYKCDNCGCTWYPELPTEFNFSEFLTKAFEEMPQKKWNALRKELKEKIEEKEANYQKMVLEVERRNK